MRAGLAGGGARNQHSRPWVAISEPWHEGGAAMTTAHTPRNNTVALILAWGLVGVPLLWGVWQTLLNALQLFH